MKFKVQGREWEFDADSLTVAEAREIQRHTGMGLRAFGQGLQEGMVDSMVGMLYLAQRRAGVVVKWADFDDLNIAEIEAVPDEDEVAAAEAADTGGADPTESDTTGGGETQP